MKSHDLYAALHERGDAAADEAARALAAAGRPIVAVSACLLGERTRYDGADKLVPEVAALLEDPAVSVLPLCPEILGGMGCPRPPVHLRGDRIVDECGQDHTAALEAGAARADALARLAGAARAVLKERSPSCASRQVHTDAGLVPGRGRFAERLNARHLPVISEEDMVQTR